MASTLTRLALENSSEVRGGARPDLLDQAAKILDEMRVRGELVPAAAAWRFGAAHHTRGEFGRANAFFEMADIDSTSTSASDRALVSAGRAAAKWAQGELALGRVFADAALAQAVDSGDDLALAVAYVSQALMFSAEGKRPENRQAYDTAIVHAERADDAITVVRIRGNMGSMHGEEGRSHEALAEIDHAIALADVRDVGLVGVVPYLSRAEVLLALGRLDEALAEVRVAGEAYRVVASRMQVFALLLEADIHRIRGNATRAQVNYRDTIGRAEETGNAQVLASAYAGYARTLFADDRAAAVENAARALDQPNTLGGVVALLTAGWVALAIGDTDAAIGWARKAISEAGRRNDLASLADGLELEALSRWKIDPASGEAVAMLAEAADIWKETSYVIQIAVNRALIARVSGDRAGEEIARRALEALGVRADVFRIAGPLQAIGRPEIPHTEVRTLGSFAVLQGGEAIATDAWPSRKSREVVKILAARRGRPMSRESLGELLWPGVPDTAPRLAVALTNARNALDPERKHPVDHFIASSHSQLLLNPDTVRVDIAEFEQVARAALRAVEQRSADSLATLEAAAAIYVAPFLADEVEEDWTAEIRDEMRDLSASVKRALVRLLAGKNDPERATGWLMSLLNDDPFDGKAHHSLISVLARAHRFSEAKHAYRRYSSRMAELDVKPVPLEQLVGSRLGT